MNAKKIKKIVVRRNNVLSSLKLIQQFNQDYTFDRDFPQLKFRIEKLDELWDQFDELQTEIECEEEADEELSAVRISFETEYFQLKGSLTEKLDAVEVDTKRPLSPVAPPVHSVGVRLPELKIPEFSGNFEEWTNFHDLFVTLIHTNHHLSSVQKFQYLKAVLKGEALRLVESLSVSSENYTIAWDSLRKRYDNKNLQIKQHFSALLSTNAIRKESATALSNLADEFDKHVCVLNKLENCDDHWNSFLIELLSSKLDPITLKEWESQLDINGRPMYDELVAFIQKRSRILQSITLSQTSQQPIKPEIKLESKTLRNKTVSYHSTNNDNLPKCRLCKLSHSLMQCVEFRKLSPQQRFEVAKKHGLCLNCLRSSHMMKNCTAGSCRTCSKRHHTLLHLNSTPKSDQNNDQSNTAIQVAQYTHHSPSVSVVGMPSSFSCIADDCNVVSRITEPVPSLSDGHSNYTSSLIPPSISKRKPSGSAQSSPQVTNCQDVVPVNSNLSKTKQFSVFMLTAYVRVKDIDGNYHFARALLDCASEANFVTESLAQTLRLKRLSANIDVYGISQSVKKVKQQVPIVVSSRINSYTSCLSFLILPSLTRILPTVNVNVSKWIIPRHVPLADPKFNVAHDVDMIIGIKSFFDILEDDQIALGSDLPVLRKTVFGYVVAGEALESKSSTVVCNVSTFDNLDSIVRKFWEVESFESGKVLSLEEQYCETHFEKTHSRANDGRYVIRLPIREEMLFALGESLTTAKRRFFSIEKKLASDPQLLSEYTKFMDEYQLLQHMEEIEPNHSIQHFYLPHHSIQRPESTTTKTRVVFDASCRGSNNISLNDICYIGPNVQPSLLSILLNFRLPKNVVTADIEKMYRQIIVHTEDRPLQQIVWRKNPTENLKHYRLNTVTYGTASAPYLATRVLNQLADDEAQNYPLAALKVKKSFYVDDYLSGEDDENRLIETNQQLIALLRSGGFSLRKWSSNNKRVLAHIPESLRDTRSELKIGQSGLIKTLGLNWHPVSDRLSFNVPEFELSELITKRTILSEMSRLFDPLGLVGAAIVMAKIFLQSLWANNYSWNDSLPSECTTWWKQYREEIYKLASLTIPRRALNDNYTDIELHCFADASDRAYGSCVYMKTTSGDGTSVSNLVISKSRVSSLTKLSTPRLELCAALLAAQLAELVLESTSLNIRVTYWTDSTIVLHWLASSSSV
ncbi:uncharacterized protein LOC129761367 [Toxorhynchites rutilus septentrionalis]|uniref:uncharacterized protein LOC129761367 n=1 Tax=Toxorhynchites rutilus septentrionalis TaxID=329112 RepID=UPI002478D2FD|nr:uncharacterized protein LOC129761367 [Toxorhynchites rutilus septentrionalis]